MACRSPTGNPHSSCTLTAQNLQANAFGNALGQALAAGSGQTAGSSDLIVSGDSDLLNLKRYQGIDIVTAGEALARVSAAATGG